jgi:hypothetical protein
MARIQRVKGLYFVQTERVTRDRQSAHPHVHHGQLYLYI